MKIYNYQTKIYIFLICVMILSNIYFGNFKLIGNFSIRVPVITIAFFYSLRSKHFYHLDSYILLFFLYLFGYLYSTIFTDSDLFAFFKVILISNFIFSFILYFFILNSLNIDVIIKIIVYVLSINSIFIIGQFFHIDFFWETAKILYFIEESAFIQSLSIFDEIGVVKGLVGTAYSGYVLVMVIPFAFYLLDIEKRKYPIILIILVNVLASLILQQRAAFYVVIFSVILSSISLKRRKVTFIVWIGLLLFISLLYFNFFFDSYKDVSRLLDISRGSRMEIFSKGFNFCLAHPIVGGLEKYLEINNGVSPHNALLNAWIRGGILGLSAILLIIVKSLSVSLKSIYENFGLRGLPFYSGVVMINLIVLSFTHNASFATGDILHFTALGVLLKSNLAEDQ